jgi:ParB-like chromosome segregation protein Spo0J
MAAETQTEKERTLAKARRASLTYLSLRNDLADAREALVDAIVEASQAENSQWDLAASCSFPDIDEDFVFSRSRIQQFLRERRKKVAA